MYGCLLVKPAGPEYNPAVNSRLMIGVVSGLALVLTACAGSKIIKEPIALQYVEPLAIATRADVTVALAWVIVRDGPGSWARNADWDEYIIVVQNAGAVPVEVASMALRDSLGERVPPELDRQALVRASREAVRRYRDADLKVKAGFGGAALVATGAVLWYGVAAPIAVVATGYTALGVATGAVIAAPILVVGGIMRANNQRKVNAEIVRRNTTFPFTIAPGEERTLSVFFPLTPSPQRIDIELGTGVLSIDTAAILTGLHLPD